MIQIAVEKKHCQVLSEKSDPALGLFGSVLREDFSTESDIDVLVELSPRTCPGFSGSRAWNEISLRFLVDEKSICAPPRI